MSTSDTRLLQRFEQLLRVSQRIKKNEVAVFLELSDVDLLRKLVEWGQFLPFKIDGDMIVVDSIADFTSMLDAQFDAWDGSERVKYGKMNDRTQRAEAVSLPTKKVAENDATVKVIPSKDTTTGAPTASSAERLADTLGKVTEVGPQKPAGIEKNNAHLAGIFGPPPDKMAQYEVVERLVKTTSKAPSKQKDTATSSHLWVGSTTFGQIAKARPQRPAEPPSSPNTGKTGQKLVVPSTQIQKASAKAENLDNSKPAAVAVTSTKTVYSREENAKRIEKDDALGTKLAEIFEENWNFYVGKVKQALGIKKKDGKV